MHGTAFTTGRRHSSRTQGFEAHGCDLGVHSYLCFETLLTECFQQAGRNFLLLGLRLGLDWVAFTMILTCPSSLLTVRCEVQIYLVLRARTSSSLLLLLLFGCFMLATPAMLLPLFLALQFRLCIDTLPALHHYLEIFLGLTTLSHDPWPLCSSGSGALSDWLLGDVRVVSSLIEVEALV